jgi:hypothetical protein
VSVSRLLKNPLSWVVAANVGLFAALTGGRIVWPGHTSWLMWGDTATHYLGWEFFRRGPLNVWPPGASPLYGAGYSSSVVYTDAIPLLALPMKFLLAFTDARFQYLGIWLLTCFVLQGVFAVKLLQRFDVRGAVLVPGALLFSVAPIFLYRMVTGGYGHMALAGHFLVLWAIWLLLDSTPSHRRWAVILVVSLLVQFYLFVIVGYLYVVAVIWSRTARRRHVRGVIANVSLVLIAAYLVGYFMSGSAVADGFGVFRMDLVGFVDSSPVDFPGWSRILPNVANTDGTHEGYSFLGTGIIALGLFATARALRRRARVDRRLRRLVAAVLPMFFLAVSNRMQVAGRDIAEVPLPGRVENALNVIRATGRFVWPLVYVIGIAAIVLTTRVLRARLAAATLVTLALVTQVFDARTALLEVRERFEQSSREVPIIQDDRWKSISAGADCLVTSPPQLKGPLWIDFADFALAGGMSTNASYLTRWDQRVVDAATSRAAQDVYMLATDPTCVYVVVPNRNEAVSDVVNTLARRDQAGDGNRHAIEVLDGFVVVRRLSPAASG